MIVGSELIEVESIRVISFGKLELKFSNGIQRQVDLTPLLKSPPPVFVPLKDEAEFRKIAVNPVGGVQWECGADLSADFLLDY